MSDPESPKLARLSSVRQALDPDEIGRGQLVGVLRPEYGDEHGELQCDNCAAGWVGLIGEPCGWCERAVDSRLSDGELSVLHNEHPLDKYLSQRLDWDEFWSGEHDGEGWVAEPLIPAGRLVALYAPAKQGKSEVALAVVAALATGGRILGQRNDAGPVDVVYLDYEMTQADLSERLELLGYSADDDLSHLHYYSLPSLPPLDTALGCDVLRGLAAHHEAKAVVIDTMGRAVEGDENSNDTYRDFARHTGLGLKSDGVAVVRTDHAGKDREKGQRGASAKNDDADVVFRVDRVEQGWKIQRTHTRINWVPESYVIERDLRDDGTLMLGLVRAKPTYPEGTKDYVAELKQAGITVDTKTTKKQLTDAAQAAGIGRSGAMMGHALRFMKGSLSTFTDGPTRFTPKADSRLSGDDEMEEPW